MLLSLGWQPSYADLADVPSRVVELLLEMRTGQAFAPRDEPVKASGVIGGVQVGDPAP
jgi:hypothetical protein